MRTVLFPQVCVCPQGIPHGLWSQAPSLVSVPMSFLGGTKVLSLVLSKVLFEALSPPTAENQEGLRCERYASCVHAGGLKDLDLDLKIKTIWMISFE